MSEKAIKGQRPLSPHLQVYRLPMTAKLSILHRASGVVLVMGTLLVAAWLVAAVLGEEQYNFFMTLAGTQIGTLVIFGWSVALFYHMCSGMRHLCMDIGFFIREGSIGIGLAGVILGTLLLTGATWYCAYKYHGVELIKAETLSQVTEVANGEQE